MITKTFYSATLKILILSCLTLTINSEYVYKCDFETNFCDWIANSTSSNSTWLRQNGISAEFGSAPLSDVTKQNSLGFYAYTISSTSRKSTKAILKSPKLNYKKEICVEFWYQLNIPDNSGLKLYLSNNSKSIELWKRYGNRADTWSHAYVNLPNDTVDKWIEFQSSNENKQKGYTAIDDVQIILESCPTTQFCDFESSSICSYQHDASANFKWERNKGKTTSLATGPKFDHTYQTDSGYYMYIKSRSPQKEGQKARLVTEKIQNIPGGICLNFWFMAYGKTVGELNVYTKIGNTLSKDPIWSVKGNQGDQWKIAAVTVQETENFQIVFEGVVGQQNYSDIAIDDVFIDTKSACRPTSSCSFEDSFCLWTPLATNEFNLLRITPQQLQTLAINKNQTTIETDASDSKYGHFIWVNPSYYPNVGVDKKASIVSETIVSKNFLNRACFTFMYIINGANPGMLNVYRKLSSLPNKIIEYTLSGDHGNDWRQASIPFSKVNDDFEIYIEFILGNTYGNMAVDDIFIIDGDCLDLQTTSNPVTNTELETTYETTSSSTFTTTSTTTTASTTSITITTTIPTTSSTTTIDYFTTPSTVTTKPITQTTTSLFTTRKPITLTTSKLTTRTSSSSTKVSTIELLKLTTGSYLKNENEANVGLILGIVIPLIAISILVGLFVIYRNTHIPRLLGRLKNSKVEKSISNPMFENRLNEL